MSPQESAPTSRRTRPTTVPASTRSTLLRRARRKTTAAALMAVAALFTTAACSAPGPGVDEVAVMGEDPRIIVHDFSTGPEMALTLELEYLPEEGCLVAHSGDQDSDEGVTTMAPLWPTEVSPLNEDGMVGVTVASVGPVVSGDTFTAAGAPWDLPGGGQDIDLPRACLPEDGFVLLNGDSIGKDTG